MCFVFLIQLFFFEFMFIMKARETEVSICCAVSLHTCVNLGAGAKVRHVVGCGMLKSERSVV